MQRASRKCALLKSKFTGVNLSTIFGFTTRRTTKVAKLRRSFKLFTSVQATKRASCRPYSQSLSEEWQWVDQED